MKRPPIFSIFAPLVLAALACTLTKPTGAELAPVPEPTKAPVPATATVTKTVKLISSTSTPTPAPQYCAVNSEALNIRQCAGTDCPIIAWALRGDRLQLLTAGPWALTARGWINTQFCEELP